MCSDITRLEAENARLKKELEFEREVGAAHVHGLEDCLKARWKRIATLERIIEGLGNTVSTVNTGEAIVYYDTEAGKNLTAKELCTKHDTLLIQFANVEAKLSQVQRELDQERERTTNLSVDLGEALKKDPLDMYVWDEENSMFLYLRGAVEELKKVRKELAAYKNLPSGVVLEICGEWVWLSVAGQGRKRLNQRVHKDSSGGVYAVGVSAGS